MEKLDGYNIKKLNLNLIKRGDIISFDGPLLSHFYDENGINYLMNWVDCDDNLNRWLLFTVEKYSLYEYFSKTKSLKNLIKDSNEIVYFLDIDNNIETKNVMIISKAKIPRSYLPTTDSYFDDEISTKYSKNLKDEILNVYSNYNLKNVVRKIKNYDLHNNDIGFKQILDKRNIKNTLMEIVILKATETPLRILVDHYKHLNSFEHILSRAHSAYKNPFELDAYFYELDNVLNTKVGIAHYPERSHPEVDIRNTFGNLVKCTIGIVESNPEKYHKYFESWKTDIRDTDLELSDLIGHD
ncbi:hypothetical protein HER15_08100 [Tenacibaculum mesophilum]|uniref:Uncharacterized protein n=1 Tax=Tenacibaculum mesophilum TaxID=104268 RepID=A0AAE9MPJ3_9FLAO|nr:hypothetical protein [Tenacibaculum mesophilum]UTD15428.1 hypothetical protein HER15_08100 [Tenacibaculum mesophilum]